MARVIFTSKFNYRWPSRAVTEFRPHPDPRTVKAEVAIAAINAGCAIDAAAQSSDSEPGPLDGQDSGADGPADGNGDDAAGGEPGLSDDAGS